MHFAFFLNGFYSFVVQFSSQIRAGQIYIFALALGLYGEESHLIDKLLINIIENCILCCRMSCTELQIRKSLITGTCFADTKTARSVLFEIKVSLSVLRMFYQILFLNVNLSDIRKASFLHSCLLTAGIFHCIDNCSFYCISIC